MRAVAALVALLALSGCGAGGPGGGSVTVFAAASLTDAFTAIAEAFEAEHDGVAVDLSFAASSALREQILAGAPADVFASANEANVDALVDAGEVRSREDFATNVLEIAVPAGNPGRLRGLRDFADGDLLLGLCAPEAPCGQLAHEALERAGIAAEIDTEEPDVRSLLTKIEAGELDGGIVYHSDVVAAGGAVDGITVPEATNVVATYPIAVLDEAGEAFVAFVLSAAGQAILAGHGFGPA